MSTFISWSGEENRVIGRSVRSFVRECLATDQVFMSDLDIDAGALSMESVHASLQGATSALVLVSKKSMRNPWLNFEAGAIGMQIEKPAVVPILLDLGFSDLLQPLAQFQGIRFDDRDKMLRLLVQLNERRDDRRILYEALVIIFNARWDGFVEQVRTAIDEFSDADTIPLPSDTDKLDEVLKSLRALLSRESPPTIYSPPRSLASPKVRDTKDLMLLLGDFKELRSIDMRVAEGGGFVIVCEMDKAPDVILRERLATMSRRAGIPIYVNSPGQRFETS